MYLMYTPSTIEEHQRPGGRSGAARRRSAGAPNLLILIRLRSDFPPWGAFFLLIAGVAAVRSASWG
jgi:hypothetical protein